MATGILTTMALGVIAWAGTQLQNIPIIEEKIQYIEKDRNEIKEQMKVMRKEIRTDIMGVRKVLEGIQKDLRNR